jgi:hypothetical protein
MPDRIYRRINGPRGSVLLAGLVLALGHAFAFFPPVSLVPAGLALVSTVVPLYVYAVLWAISGVVAFVGAVTKQGKQRDLFDAWGHGLLAGMLLLWGVTYLLGWAVEPVPGSRVWLVGILYLAVGWLITEAARMTNPGPKPLTRTHAR